MSLKSSNSDLELVADLAADLEVDLADDLEVDPEDDLEVHLEDDHAADLKVDHEVDGDDDRLVHWSSLENQTDIIQEVHNHIQALRFLHRQ